MRPMPPTSASPASAKPASAKPASASQASASQASAKPASGNPAHANPLVTRIQLDGGTRGWRGLGSGTLCSRRSSLRRSARRRLRHLTEFNANPITIRRPLRAEAGTWAPASPCLSHLMHHEQLRGGRRMVHSTHVARSWEWPRFWSQFGSQSGAQAWSQSGSQSGRSPERSPERSASPRAASRNSRCCGGATARVRLVAGSERMVSQFRDRAERRRGWCGTEPRYLRSMGSMRAREVQT
jgi:hypothetical protein